MVNWVMFAYVVKTKTAVIAPILGEKLADTLKEQYNLDPHLDRVFLRIEIGGKQYAWITGRAVRYAFWHVRGTQEIKPKIFGLIFDAKKIVPNKFRTTPPNKPPTVVVTELIPPRTIGLLVFEEPPPEELKKAKIIQIGGWKTHGFGFVRIFWDKQTKFVLE